MSSNLSSELTISTFEQHVYLVISHIPEGKVSSYGRVATLAGYPGYARHVGKLLATLPKDSTLPWFRVVNSQGQISLKGDDLTRQKKQLIKEDVNVSESGKVDLRKYLWQP